MTLIFCCFAYSSLKLKPILTTYLNATPSLKPGETGFMFGCCSVRLAKFLSEFDKFHYRTQSNDWSSIGFDYRTFDWLRRDASTIPLMINEGIVYLCWLKQLENFRKFSLCWNLAINVLANHSKNNPILCFRMPVHGRRGLYRMSQKFVPLLYKSVTQNDWTW